MKTSIIAMILGTMSLGAVASTDACLKMNQAYPGLTEGRTLLTCVPTEYRLKHPKLHVPEICFAFERAGSIVNGAFFDSANRVVIENESFSDRYMRGENVKNETIRQYRAGFVFDGETGEGMITYLKEGMFKSERYGKILFKCQ